MKKYLLAITLFATLVLWSGCTQEETNKDEYAFTGTVVDAASGEPIPNVPVMVTNGTHIYTSTKTDANGIFRLYINIYEINNQHYIWIGDETMEQKRVEIRGFSSYETNLGTFKLQCQGAPVVETVSCYIGKETVACTASIKSDGYLEIIEKGFCYGKKPKPSVDDEKIVCGSGKGNFRTELLLSKFDKSSNYYIRPYAKNAMDIGYGKEISFTTKEGLPSLETSAVTNIRAYSATLNGEIINSGAPEYSERGFVYSTTENPTIDNYIEKITSPKNSDTKFSCNLTDLASCKTYYARAYATNINGTAYSPYDEVFTTQPVLPTVYTFEIEDMNYAEGAATLRGRIDSTGEPAYSERGFVYSTNPEPTINDNCIPKSGTGTGIFSNYVTGLPKNKTFYVRAYAINEGGVAYGNEVSVSPGFMVIEGTNIMVQTKDLGQGDWDTAKSMCKYSTVGGYTDWRLPTIAELTILYNNKYKIGGFKNSYYLNCLYWSSTETGSGSHYCLDFYYDVDQESRSNYHTLNVRAVRTIK